VSIDFARQQLEELEDSGILEPVDNKPRKRPYYAVYTEPTIVDNKLCAAGSWLHTVSTKGGKPENEDHRLASPIFVEAITRCDGADYGRLLRFVNSDDDWKEWAMPMESLKGGGEDVRGELLRLGVDCPHSQRGKLASYIQSWNPKRRAICASRTGWHGKTLFVLPSETIGEGDVVFQSFTAARNEYTRSGTIAAWEEEIGKQCTGNPFLIFSVCCALAGPLLSLLNKPGAGVHFYGDSSKGKTTGSTVAASVWGKPQSFMSTWRATSNGLEGAATMRNDCIMILDEIGQAEPREVGAAAYMLGNGSGKVRAARSGSAREIKQWCLFVMSNGEAPVESVLRSAGVKVNAGQEVRLPSIPITGAKFGAFDNLHQHQKGKAFADALQESAASHYGHIGPAFINALIEAGEEIDLRADHLRLRSFFNPTGDQAERVAGNFTIVGLAGELATSFGLLPWKDGTAIESAAAMFDLWAANREKGDSEDAVALRQIEAFISKHGDSRFEYIDANGNGPVIRNRAGWWKKENISGRVFMFTKSAIEEACPGSDVTRIAKALDRAGWICEKDADGRLAKKTTTSTGRPRLYWIQPVVEES
jgi:putative DNA primase/helicase